MRGPSRIEFQLDKALKKRGRTRYWLSKVTGIHQVTLYNYQSGRKTGMRFDTLAMICDAMDCDPGEILVRVPNR